VSAKHNAWISFVAELVVVEAFKCVTTGVAAVSVRAGTADCAWAGKNLGSSPEYKVILCAE